MHHATLGRFIEHVPIGYADSPNLYKYVGGRPLAATDSMGQKIQASIKDCTISIVVNITVYAQDDATKQKLHWDRLKKRIEERSRRTRTARPTRARKGTTKSRWTCSSLPPLYVAVSRRLGYPLKLVQTNSHLLAGWDEPDRGERFNIECTSRGLVCHPHEYYLQWPVPTTPGEARRCGWLVTLTPRGELAWFLTCRGRCLYDNRCYQEAAQAYRWAAA